MKIRAAMLSVFLLSACGNASDQTNLIEGSANGSQEGDQESGSQVRAEETDLLDFAISREIIGLNPAFVDRKLGIPRETSPHHRVHEVAGCDVNYSIDGDRVIGVWVDITDACRPAIDGKTISERTKLSDIKAEATHGKYVASCLTSCGNAADPTISLNYPGSRSTSFVGVYYSSSYDQVSAALRVWEESVRTERGLAEFDSVDDFDAFSCVSGPPASAQRLIESATVTSLRIADDTDISTESC